ncbi:hypothetical protein ABI125_16160 [Tamlana crocina]
MNFKKKIMRFLVVTLFFCLGLMLQAQEVTLNGVIYTVKGEAVLKDGVDVTNKLSLEERLEVKKALNKKVEAIEAANEKEKALKKAEKKQKAAEKKQKKAEKALKQKEKAHSNYEKLTGKYESAQQKYEKLKKKGKLSPQDEQKWLSKIEKLKEQTAKAKRKL